MSQPTSQVNEGQTGAVPVHLASVGCVRRMADRKASQRSEMPGRSGRLEALEEMHSDRSTQKATRLPRGFQLLR